MTISERVIVTWHDVKETPPPTDQMLLFWCDSTDPKFPRHMDERMQTGYVVKPASGSLMWVIGGFFAKDLALKPIKWAYLPYPPE